MQDDNTAAHLRRIEQQRGATCKSDHEGVFTECPDCSHYNGDIEAAPCSTCGGAGFI